MVKTLTFAFVGRDDIRMQMWFTGCSRSLALSHTSQMSARSDVLLSYHSFLFAVRNVSWIAEEHEVAAPITPLIVNGFPDSTLLTVWYLEFTKKIANLCK